MPTSEPVNRPGEEPEASWDALGIGRLWRYLLALAGSALLVAACVSTFTDDNELGTTTLGVVGAALLVMAAAGQLPGKLSWGDKTAEFGRARTIQLAIESGAGNTEVADVAESVAETPLERSLARQLRMSDAPIRALREQALSVIDDQARLSGAVLIINSDMARLGHDARLAPHPNAPMSESIAVLISIGQPIQSGAFTRLAREALRASEVGFSGLLLVRETPADDREQEEFRQRLLGARLPPIAWAGLDETSLRQATADLLPIIV